MPTFHFILIILRMINILLQSFMVIICISLSSYRYIKIFAGRSFKHLCVMLKECEDMGDIYMKLSNLKDGLDEVCFTVGMCVSSSSFVLFFFAGKSMKIILIHLEFLYKGNFFTWSFTCYL